MVETKHWFCFDLGFENIIKLLIENHAEIDLRDNYGKSPLHFAAQNGKQNSVQFAKLQINSVSLVQTNWFVLFCLKNQVTSISSSY